MTEYIPLEYWNFPPLFTLQPVIETRKKQLELWNKLILDYHQHKKVFKMVPASFPLFSNETIDRTLSVSGRKAVIDNLLSMGNAEWEDDTKTVLNIFYKSPEVISDDIYSWAVKQGLIDSVFTIFELYAGDDHIELGLVGMDPSLVRKALTVLEKKGKCQIILGSSPDEDGVKFLSVH